MQLSPIRTHVSVPLGTHQCWVGLNSISLRQFKNKHYINLDCTSGLADEVWNEKFGWHFNTCLAMASQLWPWDFRSKDRYHMPPMYWFKAISKIYKTENIPVLWLLNHLWTLKQHRLLHADCYTVQQQAIEVSCSRWQGTGCPGWYCYTRPGPSTGSQGLRKNQRRSFDLAIFYFAIRIQKKNLSLILSQWLENLKEVPVISVHVSYSTCSRIPHWMLSYVIWDFTVGIELGQLGVWLSMRSL